MSELTTDNSAPRRPLRTTMVVMHRYVGLSIALFLFISAITGSLLAFYEELDAAINPHLYWSKPPHAQAVAMDPFIMRERITAIVPKRTQQQVLFAHNPEKNLCINVYHGTGRTEHFIDPYTANVVGVREWGEISQGITNLMPFIFCLHRRLALGAFGNWLLGIVALLWTIDCFIALYLTFPARRKIISTSDQRGWLTRWKASWVVRGHSLFAMIFTWHRASGLWVFPLLFIFAWSAVGFNLRPVYKPVMQTLGMTAPFEQFAQRHGDPQRSILSWTDAHHAAQQVMHEQAAVRGVTLGPEFALTHEKARGLYRYNVHSSLDVGSHYGATQVWIDDASGEFVGFVAPTGQTLGNTLHNWLAALHMGTVGGTPYRLVIIVFGLLVSLLCVTGVVMWWQKRQQRRERSVENERATQQ